MLRLHRPVQFPLFSTPHRKATLLRSIAISARPRSCPIKNGHKQSHATRSPYFAQDNRATRANVSACGRSPGTCGMNIIVQGFSRPKPRFRTTLCASKHADRFRRTRCSWWWVLGGSNASHGCRRRESWRATRDQLPHKPSSWRYRLCGIDKALPCQSGAAIRFFGCNHDVAKIALLSGLNGVQRMT
jgi:hypothetical protein